MGSPVRAVILGGGMVGSVMAEDLAADPGFAVTLADRNEDSLRRTSSRISGRLGKDITMRSVDLSDPANVTKLAREHDIVLGALASRIGFQSLRAVIESGRDYCDISFFAENALDLDGLAKQYGVTAVVDCGVAPGMSNMLVGLASAELDEIEEVVVYVGGLPVERRWPYWYKAGFSPSDVIEEYVRPSRVVENGRIVIKEALSESELMEFDGIGTLEAFNTDGLRSIAYTIKAPNMREKTLRYPGHIELMRALRHTGYFSQEVVEVGQERTRVRPLDLTAALLFPKWTYQPGECDLTVMRVTVTGRKRGKGHEMRWDLLDYFDPVTGQTSMSRTTAFPNTIMARMVASGEFKRSGVNPPEFVGMQGRGIVTRFFEELSRRGVRYSEHAREF